MRTTYIKPNSATQRHAIVLRDQIREVCFRAGILADEWLELLFETGYLWAQANIPDAGQRRSFLEEKGLGYWAWWVSVYTDDDEQLLMASLPLARGLYQSRKSELIDPPPAGDTSPTRVDKGNGCEPVIND